MKQVFIKDVQMDTQTAFMANGNINIFPCGWETEQAPITLDGENLGFIIGRRGETLDALQYLTGLVANRADNAYYRVTLDIGNYRDKREQALVALARRLGGQTARTGRRNSLEPMNPYERRVLHSALQNNLRDITANINSCL